MNDNTTVVIIVTQLVIGLGLAVIAVFMNKISNYIFRQSDINRRIQEILSSMTDVSSSLSTRLEALEKKPSKTK